MVYFAFGFALSLFVFIFLIDDYNPLVRIRSFSHTSVVFLILSMSGRSYSLKSTLYDIFAFSW